VPIIRLMFVTMKN